MTLVGFRFRSTPESLGFSLPTFDRSIARASDNIGTPFRSVVPVVLNEKHLQHLLREHVGYYNTDRIHKPLRDSPVGRPTEYRPPSKAQIIGKSRITRKLRFLPSRIAMSGRKQPDPCGSSIGKTGPNPPG